MATRIKNWSEFQHFKDRSPPWIKLHRAILDQRDINVISDRSFRVLVGLWLLASEDRTMQGVLPEIDDIAFRLRIDRPLIIKALQELDGFLEHDDISVISERYQDDVPEERRGEESKVETEAEESKAPRPVKKQIPPTREMVKARCQEKGYPDYSEAFCNHYDANGWKVGGRSAMKDWWAALNNWHGRRNDFNRGNNEQRQQPGINFDDTTWADELQDRR